MQQWKSGQSVSDFILRTSIDGGPPCSHRMKVVTTLGKNRREGHTHDAVIVGSTGVRVTDSEYNYPQKMKLNGKGQMPSGKGLWTR